MFGEAPAGPRSVTAGDDWLDTGEGGFCDRFWGTLRASRSVTTIQSARSISACR